MSKRVFSVYKSVVINKIFFPCIIWGIYIDNINSANVRIG